MAFIKMEVNKLEFLISSGFLKKTQLDMFISEQLYKNSPVASAASSPATSPSHGGGSANSANSSNSATTNTLSGLSTSLKHIRDSTERIQRIYLESLEFRQFIGNELSRGHFTEYAMDALVALSEHREGFDSMRKQHVAVVTVDTPEHGGEFAESAKNPLTSLMLKGVVNENYANSIQLLLGIFSSFSAVSHEFCARLIHCDVLRVIHERLTSSVNTVVQCAGGSKSAPSSKIPQSVSVSPASSSSAAFKSSSTTSGTDSTTQSMQFCLDEISVLIEIFRNLLFSKHRSVCLTAMMRYQGYVESLRAILSSILSGTCPHQDHVQLSSGLCLISMASEKAHLEAISNQLYFRVYFKVMVNSVERNHQLEQNLLRTQDQLRLGNEAAINLMTMLTGILWLLDFVEHKSSVLANILLDKLQLVNHFTKLIQENANRTQTELACTVNCLWKIAMNNDLVDYLVNHKELMILLKAFSRSSLPWKQKLSDGLFWQIEFRNNTFKNPCIEYFVNSPSSITDSTKSSEKNSFKLLLVCNQDDAIDLSTEHLANYINSRLNKINEKPLKVETNFIHDEEATKTEKIAQQITTGQLLLVCLSNRFKQTAIDRFQLQFSSLLKKPVIYINVDANFNAGSTWIRDYVQDRICFNFSNLSSFAQITDNFYHGEFNLLIETISNLIDTICYTESFIHSKPIFERSLQTTAKIDCLPKSISSQSITSNTLCHSQIINHSSLSSDCEKAAKQTIQQQEKTEIDSIQNNSVRNIFQLEKWLERAGLTEISSHFQGFDDTLMDDLLKLKKETSPDAFCQLIMKEFDLDLRNFLKLKSSLENF